MGEMRMMGRMGDEPILWDANDPASVAVAVAKFEDAKKRNCMFFRQLPDGTQGERIYAFDPHAERIIVTPQMAGGLN